MILRLCKTLLVATIALFFILVAVNNVTDYGSNWMFVRHVLAMDTVFPDSVLKWRAITDQKVATLAYWAIIAWEMAAAAVLTAATLLMLARCRDPQRFLAARSLAAAGLTMGLLLYGLGITVTGGEWFAMWQSKTWNGLDSAARFFTFNAIVLLVLLAPEK